MKNWKPLASDKELDEAQARLEELWDIESDHPDHNELLLIKYLIEEYEDEHYAIEASTPGRVIKFMLDMKELKQKDLIPILGNKSQVSKIVNDQKHVPHEKMHALSDFLGIPIGALIPKIKDYVHFGRHGATRQKTSSPRIRVST